MLLPGQKLLLVGAGRMGSAFLGGWMRAGAVAKAITVLEPVPSLDTRAYMKRQRIRHIESPEDAVATDAIILAVKPQVMADVLPLIRHCVAANTVVLSIAAGTTVATLEEAFGAETAIVRAMPNTPAVVGRGITAAFRNNQVSQAHKSMVHGLLAAVGEVVWITEEALMDPITAVSGSGPAYVFLLAECMAKVGEEQGLPADLARSLAYTTVCGAAELMHVSYETPTRLRENVTSPKGTTAAALDVLMGEKKPFEKLLGKAIGAAAKRSRELSKP